MTHPEAMTAAEQAIVSEARDILKSYITRRSCISGFNELLDYCAFTVRGPVEQMHLLLLDNCNRLIEDRLMWTGTVSSVPFYQREILKAAILLDASGIILAHNHPSGALEPSRQDITGTQKLSRLCEDLGIRFLDHVIVGEGETYSMSVHGTLF